MEFYLLFARLARNTFLLRRLVSPSSLAGNFTVRYPFHSSSKENRRRARFACDVLPAVYPSSHSFDVRT
ncbi:hypothetical protein ACEPAG_9638 [Sanghuangporus baumii]